MLDLGGYFKYHPESLTSTPWTVGEDVFKCVVAEMCGRDFLLMVMGGQVTGFCAFGRPPLT